MRSREALERLDTIIEELKSIRKVLSVTRTDKGVLMKVPLLLEVPDHLRRTVLALIKLEGSGTADEVSEITGRARAVESGYLNGLVIAGYVKKPPREGRRQYFELEMPPE